MSRAACSPLVWPRAPEGASVDATTTGTSGRILFMGDGSYLGQRDDPIEPGQLLTREALRFRLAVVNPLNSIGSVAHAGRHSLPVGHIVTILNLIGLSGCARKFNHKGAIGQPH